MGETRYNCVDGSCLHKELVAHLIIKVLAVRLSDLW
jgi:hypothetical protein